VSLNGSGVFNVNSAGQPVVSGTLIDASVFNALAADLATALSTAVFKDGQQTITAALPMNNNKITGLGAATLATDAAQLQQSTTIGTPQNSTSGTSIDFTSIPSWAKQITITFVGVSTSGTDHLLIQIGDSGGVETSGYLGSSSSLTAGVASDNYTTGFGMRFGAAANVIQGSITLSLHNSATFTWVASGVTSASSSASTVTTSGSKSLSAALDRVRITTTAGTDTFDAGSINILYS